MIVITDKKEVTRTTTLRVLKVFWKHILPYKGRWFLMLTVIISIPIVQIIIPVFYKKFFDTLFQNKTAEETVRQLLVILVWLALFKGIQWMLRRTRGFLITYFDSRIMADLNLNAFSYLIRHSYRFFTDNFAGSLTRKVNRLSRGFEEISDQIQFALLPMFVSLAGITLVLAQRNLRLALVLLGGVLTFIFFSLTVAQWKQKYNVEKSRKDSEATGVLSDALANIHNIQLFTGFKYENQRYGTAVENLRNARLKSWNVSEVMDAIQGFILMAIEISMLYMAIVLWQRGFLTVGDFALIQLYLLSIFDRVGDFGRILRRLYEAIADASEMIEIMDEPHEIKDVYGAKNLQVTHGKIEFKDVDFSFQETRRILDKFNLVISPKEKIALVGPSGAGKSTIAKILFRFYELESGEILIDDQNISRMTQDSLHDSISLVPQEPVLFHRTLRENILYGKPSATEEEVIEAAKKARCHDFISSLPYGYETYVGERGVKLSGGERQRVAIARAILKNAPILVLDEATSSLDSESEAMIQEALRELMQGKTTIVIAHRLSTIMQMDRIVVIDDGKVISTGTHQELVKGEGTYRRLWEIQAGGFIK